MTQGEKGRRRCVSWFWMIGGSREEVVVSLCSATEQAWPDRFGAATPANPPDGRRRRAAPTPPLESPRKRLRSFAAAGNQSPIESTKNQPDHGRPAPCWLRECAGHLLQSETRGSRPARGSAGVKKIPARTPGAGGKRECVLRGIPVVAGQPLGGGKPGGDRGLPHRGRHLVFQVFCRAPRTLAVRLRFHPAASWFASGQRSQVRRSGGSVSGIARSEGTANQVLSTRRSLRGEHRVTEKWLRSDRPRAGATPGRSPCGSCARARPSSSGRPRPRPGSA